MKTVTIKDVAREADVSVASVSRVLNGIGRVGEETRRKILETAERLHYVPHAGARSLITRRTATIGISWFSTTASRMPLESTCVIALGNVYATGSPGVGRGATVGLTCAVATHAFNITAIITGPRTRRPAVRTLMAFRG